MVPTRFAVAIHILVLLAAETRGIGEPAMATTSSRLAARVNTNPVVVRRISGRLARAGLVQVRRGAGGAALSRPAGAITLDDIWRAVNADEARPLLALHGLPDAPPPADEGAAIDRDIHVVLREAFGEAEGAFRDGLRRITLQQLLGRLEGADRVGV